jgi:hypothetical protein
MSIDWRNAYLAQAISDCRMYEFLLNEKDVERCHALHYLQMASEKLAKHFLIAPGTAPKTTHRQFVRFLQHSGSNPALRRACRYADPRTYKQYVDGLLDAAQRIEQLAPTAAMDRANPEYPWIISSPTDRIKIPCQYAFPEFDPKSSTPIKKVMEFLRTVFHFLETNTG